MTTPELGECSAIAELLAIVEKIEGDEAFNRRVVAEDADPASPKWEYRLKLADVQKSYAALIKERVAILRGSRREA